MLLTSGKIHNRAINPANETKYSDVLVFLMILMINVGWRECGEVGTRPAGLGLSEPKYDCQMILSIHQHKQFNVKLPQLGVQLIVIRLQG